MIIIPKYRRYVDDIFLMFKKKDVKKFLSYMNSRRTNIKFTCKEENENKISFLDVTITRDRSSHRRYSVRKGVLRNFEKCTGKHLCQSLFFQLYEKRDSGIGVFL